MEDGSVEMTVWALHGVTGRDIINAVRRLAGTEFMKSRRYRDDEVLFKVGRHSKRFGGLVLAHKANSGEFDLYFQPHGCYRSLAILNHSWPAPMGSGASEEGVVRYIRDFRDELKKVLGIE